MGLAVESAVTRLFRIEATYSGHLRYDPDLWQQFGRELPAISQGTASTLHPDLERVTEAILDAVRRQEVPR